VGSIPVEKFDPREFKGTIACRGGLKVPNSHGLNSKTVVLSGMIICPGALPSATTMGIGIPPLWKFGLRAIEDHV
jgi:hypothetical protein